jgi:hypothetical protein
MKMYSGSSGIDPLIFNDTVPKCGLHVAHSKNESRQDFLKLARDIPIGTDNIETQS